MPRRGHREERRGRHGAGRWRRRAASRSAARARRRSRRRSRRRGDCSPERDSSPEANRSLSPEDSRSPSPVDLNAASLNFHSTEYRKPESTAGAEATESVEPAKPALPDLEISNVALCIEDNSIDHHTDKYEASQDGYIDDITKESTSAKLLLRRGQKFKVKVTVNRPYTDSDHIRAVAKFGRVPLASKGTYNEMITHIPTTNDWKIEVSSSANEVELSITSAANCAIGQWKLQFDTVTKDENGTVTKLMTESLKADCYMLFNCWCTDDPVYLEKEELRQEYVLNDSGKIYTGNSKQIFGKPWNFGQFESCVLEAALYLLNERTFLSVTSRGNPISITRKLSALVNSSDDYGVLTGRWDGNYEDGVSPTMWTGSVAILQKFMETGGKPVEYGQCWVFSGIMTSVCRALGLPTRSVTNFASAHDTDGSLTIDVHWDADDQPMPELDTDSVWNFHVWNECWMSRPDLKKGYGGWQAVDATPQETSDGVYCAGPASLAAIKEGDVGISYDAPFIFAEVNADKVHWIKRKDGSIKRILQRDVIGKNISTKAVGSSQDFSLNAYNPDREDITDMYKYQEGSSCERASVWRAAQMSTKPSVYQDESLSDDVKFVAIDLDNVLAGKDFDVTIEVENTSSDSRTVNLTATLSSVYYTGVTRTKLKQTDFLSVLVPNSKEMFKMNVKYSDYEADMVDHGSALKINYMATVKETKQIFASQDDFRLRTIIPDIKPSKKQVKLEETFKVKVSFTSPISKPLTDCVFSFEAAGNLKPTTMSAGNVKVGGTAEIECDITAKRVGDCVIISSFECKELGDMQSQCSVLVEK
ncbi:hemocyte protein-glutamine gamma-glutamyltransferase-like [Watersipora subatra]|uniref:hemocyte protein-glutamine gamma-glutamyltransferase-like n=1 Tax=Watersipora subatra TaxID=2589382 RepID=UPI00355B551F